MYSFGFSEEEVERMPYERTLQYWNSMEIIDAQQSLSDIRNINFPNLKKEAKRRVLSELKKEAYKRFSKGRQRLATVQDLAGDLARKLMDG